MSSKLIKGSIDLMKIKKDAIFKGKNGAKYINVDIWINEEEDNYGNNVGIKQSVKVGEKYESHFIGNAKTKFGFDNEAPATNSVDAVPIKEGGDILPF
jgi:hypothetical protein